MSDFLLRRWCPRPAWCHQQQVHEPKAHVACSRAVASVIVRSDLVPMGIATIQKLERLDFGHSKNIHPTPFLQSFWHHDNPSSPTIQLATLPLRHHQA